MRILLLITVVFLLGILSCKKTDNRQFSYWYVNNDSFNTNDVFLDIGKARTDFGTNSSTPGFGFTFYLSGLPTSGVFAITNQNIQNPTYAGVGIHYKGQFYNVARDLQSQLTANYINGKAQLRFGNVWFKNYNDPNDTVLVSGIFNEP